jgi:hypothetical protein
MKKKTKLLILIPLGAVLLNVLGYIVALNLKAPAKSDGAGTASAAAERAADGLSAEPAGTPAPARTKEDRVKEEKAMARRAAGMAALEAGDYERALADFAEARALAGDRAYVSELLRVTEDLAHRPPAARRPVVVRSAPPTPPRTPGRFRIVERSAPREAPPSVEPAPVAPPPAPMPSSGLLLVSTTPRGLLVHVDDVPVDLTPTRASLKVGPHRVALFDGDRKVFETSVEVKSGSPTTLARDLSAEITPSTRPAATSAPFAKDEAAAAPAPAPAPQRQAARAGAAPATALATASVVMARAPARSRPAAPLAAPSTGGLEVTSPGLYGEIWINGRSWGFPPVRAGDLPPGPTRVGVRVNGVEERSTIVAVKPGLTTSVRLSRHEAPAN